MRLGEDVADTEQEVEAPGDPSRDEENVPLDFRAEDRVPSPQRGEVACCRRGRPRGPDLRRCE